MAAWDGDTLDLAKPQIQVIREETVVTNLQLTGGDVNYYVIDITEPKRLQPCQVEVDDINHALDMRFDEGTVWKSLVRFCKLRMDAGKPGSSFVYEAEKIVYYGILILKRAAGKERLIAFLEKQLAGLKGSQHGNITHHRV